MILNYRKYQKPTPKPPQKNPKKPQPKTNPQKEKYKHINYNKTKQIEFLQKLTNDFPDIHPSITSIAPHFSSTNKNVGILFWYLPPQQPPPKQLPPLIHIHDILFNQAQAQAQAQAHPPNPQEIQILTGIETCYLTDKVVPEIKAIIQKYQIYQSTAPFTTTATEEIYNQFSKRAKLLSKELKQPIYFDKPIAHSMHPNTWQTHFRVFGEIPKFGIIKGSMEENETQIQSIQREIQEELFPYNESIPLDKNKIILLPQPIQLSNDQLYAFHYQVSEKEKNLIEKNIQLLQEENYGELVVYKFRAMKEIFTSTQCKQPDIHLLKQYFNGKSQQYIKKFYENIPIKIYHTTTNQNKCN